MNNEIKIDSIWISIVVLTSCLLIFLGDSIGLGNYHFEAIDGFVYIPYSAVFAIALILISTVILTLKELISRNSSEIRFWFLLGFNTIAILFISYAFYTSIMLTLMFLFLDITDIAGRDPQEIELAYSEARLVRKTFGIIILVLILNELRLTIEIIKKKRWLIIAKKT